MAQTGDPTGTGTGGESCWGGRPFKDEFDSRLGHNKRGIVSMANSGANSNKSQFFITLAATPHLDYKHTIFGVVVGGFATLDRIEAVGSDSKDRPLEKVTVLDTVVFTNPLEEVDRLLTEDITRNMAARKQLEPFSALPTRPTIAPATYTTVSSSSVSKSVTAAIPSTATTAPSAKSTTLVAHSLAPAAATSDQAAVDAFLKSQQARLDSSTSASVKKQKTGNYGNFSNWG